MNFRDTNMLWLLAAVPFALLFFVMRERVRSRIARRLVSERLRQIHRQLPTANRQLRPWLLVVALTLSVIALSGPLAGFHLVPIVAREANRVIALDVSNSMGAEDVGTSRLSAAKAIAMRLANAQEGRVALIVFEAEPLVVSPLTTDTDAVSALIDTVTTGEIGQPGSDLGNAVLGALRLIESDAAQKADIVVISDGEEQGTRISEAVQRAKSRGIEVSTIVIGSRAGGTIPTGRGPLKDDSGEIVTTQARTETMTQMARETGGTMLENPFDARALDPLLRHARAGTDRQTQARVPIDRYQWPLGLGIVMLFGASLLHRGAE